MGHGKWSDDGFLDGLRHQGDPLADGAVQRLVAEHDVRAVSQIFKTLRADGDPIPAHAPRPFLEFVEATSSLPPGIDQERLARGGQVFYRHAFSAVVTMLASSLPRGYAAPCLCEILSISRDLQRHPFLRLMGVVQLLVNVSNPGAFGPGGKAIVTAQKLRLLHAGVRTLVPRYRPDYQEKFGLPVNHEDMLATLMAFSYLVIAGIRRLGQPLSDAEAEDYYYLWWVFSRMMGIPDDYVPSTMAEAGEFYDSYVRRHDTGPEVNPYGTVLTQDNLEMMKRLVPAGLRLVGFGVAPAIAMAELLTPEELARVGMRPVMGHRMIRGFFNLGLRLFQDVEDTLPFSTRLAALIFQGMIDLSRGGEVTFTIPVTLAGLHSRGLE